MSNELAAWSSDGLDGTGGSDSIVVEYASSTKEQGTRWSERDRVEKRSGSTFSAEDAKTATLSRLHHA
jgi:hypothetical protein